MPSNVRFYQLQCVPPSHVQSCKDSVSALGSEGPENRLVSLLCAKVVILFTLCTHLARQTRYLVEQISQQLHTGIPACRCVCLCVCMCVWGGDKVREEGREKGRRKEERERREEKGGRRKGVKSQSNRMTSLRGNTDSLAGSAVPNSPVVIKQSPL